jgi:1-deoxy-D-xylulose-5-phosphate reductoisomerase
MKKITILGSTGSIGIQTLDVCRYLPDFKIIAMSAGSNLELFSRQVKEFKPEFVYIDERLQSEFNAKFPDVKILSLEETAALKVDVVVNALSGNMSNITKIAVNSGNNVALANKESLVYSGYEIMELARQKRVEILPVDSEHSAIFQCLQCGKEIKKIILTASGGPFLGKKRDFLETVTLEDVLKHPTWQMGKKVTVDSSTLMNKGFEFVEAMHLFNLKPGQIEIVIHPESIVHSAVEFADGSVIAQLASPDMRLPIQYALTFPERFESPVKSLSLTDIGKLTFYKPDFETFTPLKYMLKAVEISKETVIARANDVAVNKFLIGEYKYIDIFDDIERTFNDGFR